MWKKHRPQVHGWAICYSVNDRWPLLMNNRLQNVTTHLKQSCVLHKHSLHGHTWHFPPRQAEMEGGGTVWAASHRVPSMNWVPRLTMKSCSRERHISLHWASPGRERETWEQRKQRKTNWRGRCVLMHLSCSRQQGSRCRLSWSLETLTEAAGL